MGIDVSFLDNNLGIYFRCHGVLTGDELRDALKRLLKKENLESFKYAFIDETPVDSYKVSAFDLLEMLKYHKHIAVSVHDDAVVAIVAPSLLGYGLARMWEIQAADIGWFTKVFRAKPEADAWLKAKMKELFDTDINFTKPVSGETFA